MSSPERGGPPNDERPPEEDTRNIKPAPEANEPVLEQPTAETPAAETTSIDRASRVAQLRQDIDRLNKDVQTSAVMDTYGSEADNQHNRDKTYDWVESQVLDKENEIRNLEHQERQAVAQPKIDQLKSEIGQLNRDVSEQTVMAKYGGVPGNESNRDKTYDWVESQVLAKEDAIRKLETDVRGPNQTPENPTPEEPPATETVPIAPVESVVAPEIPPTPPSESPESAAPTATSAEQPPAPVEREPVEPVSIAEARQAFAESLQKRGKMVRRTSDAEISTKAQAYQEAIAQEQAASLAALKQEFEGRDLQQPEVQAEYQARFVESITQYRHAEENALREALMNVDRRSLFGKLKKGWRKSAKLRLAAGLGLMATSAVSLAIGNVPVFAGSQAARAALSGVGMGMTTETGLEFARGKWGETKKMSPEQIKNLDQDELERRLAAQTVRTAELGQGTETQPLNPTMLALRSEYERRNEAALGSQIQQELQAGKSWEEIADKAFSASLRDQHEFHMSLADRRDRDRDFKIRKTAASFGAGVLVGSLFGEHSVEKIRNLTHLHHVGEKGTEFVTAYPDQTHTAIGASAEQGAEAGGAAGHGLESIPTGRGLEEALATGTVESAKDQAVEVVHKGDTIWDLSKDQLHDRLGPAFDHMDQARQTYLIDALKDKIVANPHDFGLTNADHLNIGDKVDFTHAFQGPEAVNLDQLQAAANHLDQNAIEHILKNNELLREWVTSHPHEALNGATVEQVLSGHAPVAETGVTLVQPELADPVQQKMADSVMHSMNERMLCELQEKYPVEYARAHAEHPDLYPDRAGLIETPEPATLHLSEAGAKALKHYNQLIDSVRSSATPEAADKIAHQVGDLRVDQALKKGAVERMVDQMEGGTAKTSKAVGQSVRSILRSMPKGEYLNSEKVAEVLKRVPKP